MLKHYTNMVISGSICKPLLEFHQRYEYISYLFFGREKKML